jgi:hypothetical protein
LTVHAYPATALAGDYARAAAGFALVATPLALVPLGATVASLFGAGSLIFAAFAVRTALRQFRRLEMDDDAIKVAGVFPTALRWEDIEDVKLAYYSTRRDGRDGWMQLALAGAGRKLKIDSRIEGFHAIAAKAAEVADRRTLPVSPRTATNFAALGLQLGQVAS